LAAQGVVDLFPEKRMIHHGPANWMVRQWLGETTPELEHLRARNRKYLSLR
jgi:hypothetical protein